MRPLRTRIRPVRDAVLRHLRADHVQRSTPLRYEDRVAKRKRWHVLTDLVHEECPTDDVVVVELGVRTGENSAHLMRYCPQISVLYGVDLDFPPQDPDWVLGLPRFRFIQGDSAKTAASFADESVDLLFIDADHSECAVRRDIEAWRSKMRPGGIIAGHDYGSHRHTGVARAVDALFADHAHPIRVEANRVWWTRA